MSNDFILNKPRRFWAGAAVAAGLSGLFIAPFLADLPWLICVPIVLGSAFVTAAEFWESITSGGDAPAGETVSFPHV